MLRIRKLLIVSFFLAIAVGTAGGQAAYAAVSTPHETSYALIQNVSSQPANTTVQFFDSSGNKVLETSRIIPANGATNVFLTDPALPNPHLPSGWQGSMRVLSNQKIVSAVVTVGPPSAQSIYEGFDLSKAASTVLLPSIHWNRAGQESLIAIQNVQDTPINATLTYLSPSGAVLQTVNLSIPANSSAFRNAIQDCAACAGVEGSARVVTNSSNKVAVAVTEYLGAASYAYSGLPAASAGRTFLLPSVHNNPAGQFTFSLVQNTSTQNASVTISYRNPSGTVTDTYTKGIAPGGSFNFGTAPGSEGKPVNMPVEGSAIITSTQPVVVSVVEVASGNPYAYNGFRIDSGSSVASSNLLFPSVHRNPGGQFSYILVANTQGTPATCTMTYKGNNGNAGITRSRTIAGNGSHNFISVPGSADDPGQAFGNEGSARLDCGTGKVVGVVVETLGAYPAAYEAFGL